MERVRGWMVIGAVCLCGALCMADVIYVDAAAPGANNGTSWQDALTRLDAALAGAEGGDEIWVAKGVYRPALPGGNRDLSFVLRSEVSLYGGFNGTETSREQRDPESNPTLLSGDLNGDDQPGFVNRADNSQHVATANDVSNATLDGFILSGADTRSNSEGGALHVLGSATLGVLHCTFRDNRAQFRGAGAFVDPEFARCLFTANHAGTDGGGLCVLSGEPKLADCRFEANSAAFGGGVLNFNSAPRFTACAFTQNSSSARGCAVYNGESAPVFDRCRFTENTGEGAEAYAVYNEDRTNRFNGYFLSCAIVNNRAQTGIAVGIRNQGCSPEYINCTVAGHGVAVQQGPSPGSNAAPRFLNCVIYLNDQHIVNFAGIALVNASNIEGGYPGHGNIDANPRFVNPGAGDFRLGQRSPCIDAGHNPYLLTGMTEDLDGNPRRFDDPVTCDTGRGPAPVVDMGALESGPTGSRCIADCDQSTGCGILDVFDFLCFQDAWYRGAPLACGCDASTGPLSCDIFDFLCFQDAFVAGCP
jgi:hypothetical protein